MEAIMKLQVLLSAMHLSDYTYIDRLKITGDTVIINQCDRETDEFAEVSGRSIRFLCTKERGLSRSRNRAIREADADICILCDNDVVYCDGYEQKILSAFEKYENADILVFFIRRPEREKPVFDSVKKMNYLSVMKIFSPEIAFRRKSVLELKFHERFGAGAEYAMGEENIFLYDALRAGLKILYVPVQIAELMHTESTWFTGYTDKFFRDRGANYYAMTHRFYWLLILQFALRKYGIYKKENRPLHALKMMFQGKREYKAHENISGW